MENNIQNFYDLEAWKEGHKLVIDIYKTTNSFPNEEKFGIISQIRRASGSITANIAEGFARYHFNDKIRFYHQARGSLAEVQNFLILSKDLNFIEKEICDQFMIRSKNIAQLINGMIRSIKRQK